MTKTIEDFKREQNEKQKQYEIDRLLYREQVGLGNQKIGRGPQTRYSGKDKL